MIHNHDDCGKRRLTETNDLARAADFLIDHGLPSDQIATHLSRYFYIDIDTLNEVLASRASLAAQPVDEIEWRKVA